MGREHRNATARLASRSSASPVTAETCDARRALLGDLAQGRSVGRGIGLLLGVGRRLEAGRASAPPRVDASCAATTRARAAASASRTANLEATLEIQQARKALVGVGASGLVSHDAVTPLRLNARHGPARIAGACSRDRRLVAQEFRARAEEAGPPASSSGLPPTRQGKSCGTSVAARDRHAEHARGQQDDVEPDPRRAAVATRGAASPPRVRPDRRGPVGEGGGAAGRRPQRARRPLRRPAHPQPRRGADAARADSQRRCLGAGAHGDRGRVAHRRAPGSLRRAARHQPRPGRTRGAAGARAVPRAPAGAHRTARRPASSTRRSCGTTRW